MTQFFFRAQDEFREYLDNIGLGAASTEEHLEGFARNVGGVVVRYGIYVFAIARYESSYIPVVYIASDHQSKKVTTIVHRWLSSDERFPDVGHAVEWCITMCKVNGGH